jgi:hypothetical protein
MSKPVAIKIPFVAPVGTSGSVTLRYDDRYGDKAHLAIDMGRPISGVWAAAPLTLDGMRLLVDGLLDAIDAIERHRRIYGGSIDGQ